MLIKFGNRFIATALTSLTFCTVLRAQSDYATPYTFSTLAGTVGVQGSANGTGSAAQFYGSHGIAVDGSGNVYVADTNTGAIRKIASGGVVTTLAAAGLSPFGVAADTAGDVYVANQDGTVSEITPNGTVTTVAGSSFAYGSTDGPVATARFGALFGIAVDHAGNLYVADTGNSTIREITTAGNVATLAGSPSVISFANGTGSAALFGQPQGVAVDGSGNLYVADTDNDVIRKITPTLVDGAITWVVTTFAGTANTPGSADGTGTAAQFNEPQGVAVDSAGNVYVADSENSTIRKITSGGVVTTLAGVPGTPGSADGTGSSALFKDPQGIAVDTAGNVYVADTSNETIRWGATTLPAQTSATMADGTYGQSFSYTETFSGALTDFSASGLPSGLSINSATGVISGTSTATAGNYTVILGATNGAGTGTGSLSLSVAAALPGAPTGVSGAPGSGNATVSFTPPASTGGEALSYTVTATPSSGPGVVTATGSSSPITVDGLVNGTSYAFTVTATDGVGTGPASTASPAISVGAPALTSASSANATYGQSFSYTATFSGSPTSVYIILPSGLPAGLNFNATTGVLSGTPTSPAGTYTISVNPTNSFGTGAYPLSITIAAAIAGAPTGVSALSGNGQATVSFTAPANAGGATISSYTVTATPASGLPVTATGASSPIVVTGLSNGTVYTFAVVATNVAGTSASSVPSAALTVGLANITTQPIPQTVTQGYAASFTVAASGGVAPLTYQWYHNGTAINGATATSLSIANPQTSDAGSYKVVITDTTGNATSTAVALTVNPAYAFTTLAGFPTYHGSTNGTGNGAAFYNPEGVAVDGAGNIYVADTYNNEIRKVTSAGVVTTASGAAEPFGPGSADGFIGQAEFHFPSGVAVDSAGNAYVADTYNHTIREINFATFTVSTLAGSAGVSGSADGTGSAARFNYPTGVAVDASGNVYVADSSNDTIRQITPTINGGVTTWTVTTLAGSAGVSGSADGTGSAAQFDSPTGVAVDGSGNIYVADSRNETIRKITSLGVVTTLAGSAGNSGSADGTGNAAQFGFPQGLAVDGGGNLYVADSNAIRKVTRTGVVTTEAGLSASSGDFDGTGSGARFFGPQGVAVDTAGNLYVADTENETVRWGALAPPSMTSPTTAAGISGQPFTYTAVFSGVLGSYTATGLPAGLSLNPLTGVISGTLSSAPGLYAVSLGATNGAGAGGGTLDLTVTAGVPGSPTGVSALSGNGSATVTFNAPTLTGGSAITGYRVTATPNSGPTGAITEAGVSSPIFIDGLTNGVAYTITVTTENGAGTSTASSGLIEAVPTTPYTFTTLAGTAAMFNYPEGVAVDSAGNVYVADTGNDTIRKITNNGVVTTLAGSAGVPGSADGVGNAAEFNSPSGVAVDSAGNIYVADTYNDEIRKITSAGVVTTLAGSAGFSGSIDGTGNAAEFNAPVGMAVDGADNIYVADRNNDTIRKITPTVVSGVTTWTVTTFAGSAGSYGSADGTGNAAQFSSPEGVATDSAGNVYVADTGNCTIREITSGGAVTTLAGSANNAGQADGIGGAAGFYYPYGVAVDSAGNVYVADTYNNEIRRVTSTGVVTTLAGSPSSSEFSGPYGIAVDRVGNLYVADSTTISWGALAPPALTSATTASGTNGQSLLYTATFSGALGDYSASGLPSGLGINPATGVISGIITAAPAVYTVTLGAANGAGAGSGTLTITIAAAPPGVPTITDFTPSAGIGFTVAIFGTSFTGTTAVLFNGISATFDVNSDTMLFALVPTGSTSGPITVITPNGTVSSSSNFTTGLPPTIIGFTPATIAAGASETITGTNFISVSAVQFNGVNAVFTVNSSTQITATVPSGTPANCTISVITPFGSHTINSTAAALPAIDGFTPATIAAGVTETITGTNFSSASSVQFNGVNAAFTINSSAQITATVPAGTPAGGTISVTTAFGETTITYVPVTLYTFTTLAGTAGVAGSADGTGGAAQFHLPTSVAVDGAGNVYVADTENAAIRKITSAGVVTTLAGSAAQFRFPYGVAVDNAGNVYVADQGNDTIRKITSAGVVTTLAGTTGIAGSTDGTGSAALFDRPSGVAVDSAGNVYVADTSNNTIRKITSAGVVTTLAGTPGTMYGGSADGTGSAAQFYNPRGVAVDSAGNVYVADQGNNMIRKITSGGVVTTLAGTTGGVGPADGIGSTAQFYDPLGVAVDGAGNVYVADTYNDTIRKITSDGAVTTIAGTAGSAGSANGTGSAALFNTPNGLAADSAGDVYVADSNNNTIREGSFVLPPTIDSSAEAAGRVGVPFAGYTITASNSPNLFAATGLPSGLTLSGAVISGTPTTAGSFTVSLTATNTPGTSAVFPLTFVIAQSLNVPVIGSSPTASGTAGAAFTPYAITASNAPTSFSATGLPTGLTVNPSTGIISGTPTVSGTFTALVSATNATDTGPALQLTITIAPAASSPVISSNLSAGATFGSAFSYAIAASNAPTSFNAIGLPSGLTINGAVISGTPTAAGVFDVALAATNASGTGTAALVLTVAPGFSVPVISSSSQASGQVGSSFSYAILANNAPTAFNSEALPSGLTLSATSGIISGTPAAAGTFTVRLLASNAAGPGQAFTLTITIASAPQAPAVTSAATASGTVGVLFNYTIVTNIAATSYAATGLPTGLSLNSFSGVIAGTPSAAGTTIASITASNSSGASAPLTLIIAVAPSASSPSITSSLTAAGTQNQAFTYTVTASNMPAALPLPPGDGYSATGLPAGLGINPSTGVISGMPANVGTTSVVLTAANDAGASEPVILAITINPAGNAPSITSGNTAGATVGSAFAYQIMATPAAISYAAVGSPAWLGINTTTGVLSGTPGGAPGNYTVVLTATNSIGTSAPLPLAITVDAAAGTPVVTSTIAPAADTADLAYADTAGGCLYPIQVLPSGNIQYYFVNGGLPAGLSLDPALGLIYGTPTVPGTYAVSVGAANEIGIGVSTTITLTIKATPGTPTISNTGGSNASALDHTAEISEDGAPTASGNVGSSFSFQIAATGNPTDYAAANLPAGLAINPSTGIITGIPSMAGAFTAQISASNGSGIGISTDLVITISPPIGAPTLITSVPATGTAGTAFTYQMVASNTPTSYNASGLPAGLTLNSSTGLITGTPTVPGIYTVSLSANNASGTGSIEPLSLTIAAAAGAPAITSVSTASGTVGEASAGYQVTASNGPITAYAAINLPPGLAIDPVGGSITGTPTTAGSYTATLTATNSVGPSSPFALFITVDPAATSSSVTSAATAPATAGVTFNYQITANNSPISFNVTGLPAGLTVNTTTGLISGSASIAGSYPVTISVNNATGTGATYTLTIGVADPANYARLVNLSARAFVGTGSNILIAGFGIAGAGTKELLLRADGPLLGEAPADVSDALDDVELTLYDSGIVPGESVAEIIASNNGWANSPVPGNSPAQTVVIDATATLMNTLGAVSYLPNSLDSALDAIVPAGNYTYLIGGTGANPTGVALAEVYDADAGIPDTRLVNISGRAEVGTGFNILIAGFGIAGNTSETVLIRGVGPGLYPAIGAGAYLANPLLQLYDSHGLVIASNSGWSTAPTLGNSNVQAFVQAATATVMASVGAQSLAPNSTDAAMVVTLPIGNYTAQLSGVGGTTGIGLVEIYEVP